MPPVLAQGVYLLNGRLPMRGLNFVNVATLDILQADPLLLLELLPLIFPDAGLALHNILRLGNPGYDIVCVNNRSGNEDPVAQQKCRDMLLKANRGVDCDIPGAMGGPTALINSLFFSTYFKGAACAETVLNETLDDLDDIVYVDPFSIEFLPILVKRGRYKICQIQIMLPPAEEKPPVPTMPANGLGIASTTISAPGFGGGNRVELNPNLITYVPVDETMYGRPPVASALQLLIFWMRFYLTLQVFLHNSAFGEKDGSVDTNLIRDMLPDLSDEEQQRWNDDFFGELIKLTKVIGADYKKASRLDPDGALIHPDILTMTALGTAKSTYPVEAVQKVCKREIFNALKMMPVLMGSNEGSTETHATVQMAVFTSGLSYYQSVVKHVIERALLTGLRAQGYAKNVTVELRFKTLTFEDRLAAAQAIAAEIDNAIALRDENFITQTTAGVNVTGTPPAGPAPGGNPDPDVATWAPGDGTSTGAAVQVVQPVDAAAPKPKQAKDATSSPSEDTDEGGGGAARPVSEPRTARSKAFAGVRRASATLVREKSDAGLHFAFGSSPANPIPSYSNDPEIFAAQQQIEADREAERIAIAIEQRKQDRDDARAALTALFSALPNSQEVLSNYRRFTGDDVASDYEAMIRAEVEAELAAAF